MASTGRTRYKNDWQREHTDRIHLTVPIGRKETIRDHAQARGESVNGFINRAVNEVMSRDQEKEKRKEQIAQIAAESGQSAEDIEHDMEIEEALALLERDAPGIQNIYAQMRMVRRMSGKS